MYIILVLRKYVYIYLVEGSVVLWYSSAAISADMNGRVYGALVQFGFYQLRYEWKGLWCFSTVRVLSIRT